MIKKIILVFIFLFLNIFTYGQREIQLLQPYKYIETEFGKLKIQRISNSYDRQTISAIDNNLLDCILKVEDYLRERSLHNKSDSEIEVLFNNLTKSVEANNIYFDVDTYKTELRYYKRHEARETQKASNIQEAQKKFDSLIDSKVKEREINDSIENSKQKVINEAKEKEKRKLDIKKQVTQKKQETISRAKRKLDNEKKKIQRRQDIIDKYGKENGEAILNHKVKIGWTKSMCVASWGKPYDINRTTNAYGTHEQYVYSLKKYLYFENGILTAIQD